MSNVLLDKLRRLFHIRNWIAWILFFSFTYSPIRRGYIKRKCKNLSSLKNSCHHESRSRFKHLSCQSRPFPLGDLHLPVANSPKHSRGKSGKLTIFASKRRRNTKSGGPKRNSIATVTLNHQQLDWSGGKCETSEVHVENDCPLGKMPALFHYYQYFSHSFIYYLFFKCVLLKLIRLEMFGFKHKYDCYLPGRVTVLPEFDLGLLVSSYHVIYRSYLCILKPSFNLDCFLFLLIDPAMIEAKRHRLLQLQETVQTNAKAYKEFVENRFFYHQVNLTERTFLIRFKINRSIEQHFRLRLFFNKIVNLFAINFCTWSIPFLIVAIYCGLSSNHWKFSYGHCTELYSFIERLPSVNTSTNQSNIKQDDDLPSFLKTQAVNYRSLGVDQNVAFHWDTTRYLLFAYDFIETIWLLFDSSNGLIWPFCTLCICAQDMSYSMDSLCAWVSRLVAKLERTLEKENQPKVEAQTLPAASCRQHSTGTVRTELEEEILILQSNLVVVLNQLEETDVFVSRLTAFCIFVWVTANIYYELVTLSITGLLVPNSAVQYMQFLGFIALTFSFSFLSSTHTRTLKLYRLLCNLVAMDPNFQSTKYNWPWVLEYFYHKGSSRYSFHLGPSAELSMTNYLKGMSWIFTCGFVMLNLLGYKREILVRSHEGA